MKSYEDAVREFDLARVAEDGLSGTLGAVNAFVECCGRYVDSDRVALIFESKNGHSSNVSYKELDERSARFANFLHSEGIGAGDCVACLLPRTPELVITLLATWRIGAVYLPLFTAFGPKAIEHRLKLSGAKLIVTDSANRTKLDELDGVFIPVVTVAAPGTSVSAGDHSFGMALAAQKSRFEPCMRTADDDLLIMFTSGTTGAAKSLRVPIRALLAFKAYLQQAVGVHEADRYWNVADPGWAYGLYYALSAPLSLGMTTLLSESPFTADGSCDIIQKHRINVLAGSPTAFRMLMVAGDRIAQRLKGTLERISSAGEPLTPEIIRWCADKIGAVIHDHYGQTELGMVLCNHHGLEHPIHIGSAGYSVPGHRVSVVDPVSGKEQPANEAGILAVDRSASPLFWFRGYEGRPEPFMGKYYLTGDAVKRNDDGTISFVGRADDVITTSGYRVGPFDVESALSEHPCIAEVAVVGKPDAQRTEIIKAFIVLRPGYTGDTALTEELTRHVRNRLSAHAFPREYAFVGELPKTPSGKIQRYILRQQ